MISQTAEYALRAVVYLASQDETPRTVAHIAQATHTPARYLAKIMLGLGRAGLAKSKRGLDGGFTLSRPASTLSILEVVNAVDPIRRYAECPLGIESHGRRLCPLHRRLDEAAHMVEQAFGDAKVSDLIEAPRRTKSDCRFPSAPQVVT
jgi:Rrf2 family nitric oxide-sensitive transcriptional repressor